MLLLSNLIQNVYADDAVDATTTVANPITGNLQSATISGLLGYALNIILGLGWALTFIMLAMGFIKYITSKGETKATDSARNWLTFAALGGVGLLFLTVIKSIILKLVGGSTPGGGIINPFGGGTM
jgi:hypothetical protein